MRMLDTLTNCNWDDAYNKDATLRMLYNKFKGTGKTTIGFEIMKGMRQYNSRCGLKSAYLELFWAKSCTLYKTPYITCATSKHMAEFQYNSIVHDWHFLWKDAPECPIHIPPVTRLPGNPRDFPRNARALLAFEYVGVDFITHLPKPAGFDEINAAIDKFSRYGIFISNSCDYAAVSMAGLFLIRVISLGWIQSGFMADRGTRFLRGFCGH